MNAKQSIEQSLDINSLNELRKLFKEPPKPDIKPIENNKPVEKKPHQTLTLEYLQSLIWIVKHRKEGFYLVPLYENKELCRKIICPVKGDISNRLTSINKQVKITEIIRDNKPQDPCTGVLFVKTDFYL